MAAWLKPPESLLNRVILAGGLLLLTGLAASWWVMDRSIRQSAEMAVDRRLIGQLTELQGAWLASRITNRAIDVQSDLLLLWQIEAAGCEHVRSIALIENGVRLPDTARDQTPVFTSMTIPDFGPVYQVSITREEKLGCTPGGSGSQMVTYWAAVTGTWRQELINEIAKPLYAASQFAILGHGVVLALALAVIALVIRWPLQRLQKEAEAFAAGHQSRLGEDHPSELAFLASHLNAAIDRHERGAEKTKRYINKIAHDLKTPIAVAEQALADPSQHDVARKRLSAMRQTLDRYATLATAIGPGQPQPLHELRPQLCEAVEAMSLLYRATPWNIELEADDGLKARIAPQDVDTAVSNLLTNAHHHAHSAAILFARARAGWLEIGCEDDGPGLSPDDFQNVLGWGARLDTRPAGSGFGLAILQDLAALYEGEISQIQSRLGGLGIVVSLRVPGP